MSMADIIRVEGVNCKGFGIIAKAAMVDPEISIESKAIYAYFCSYAGAGNTSFPSRTKVLKDLQVSKSTYYTHFNKLVQENYIRVDRGNFGNLKGRNIYTIISKPAKFKEKDNDNSGKIMMSGLKSAGYGTIPKAVMQDERLPIKAKGIYAYFCSITGNGECAFPRKEIIIKHLAISEKTYYKFFRVLNELNYITTIQRHENGRLGVNDYYLNDLPDITTKEEKEIQHGKIWDIERNVENPAFELNGAETKSHYSEIQHGKIQYGKKQDIQKQDIQNWDNNKINNTKINNTKINNSINQSAEGMTDRKNIFIENFSRCIPEIDFMTLDQTEGIEKIVHNMTQYNRFINLIKDPFKLSVFKIFNQALIEMLDSDDGIVISGKFIRSERIRKKISSQIFLEENKMFFVDNWNDIAMTNFTNACRSKSIHNHLGYMCSCIWSALSEGDIAIMAAIERDFPKNLGEKI